MLEFACVGGNPDIVRLILDRIQFQEEHADELQLPLHRAVEMGNYQCAQVIIDKIGLDKLKQQGQMDPSTYELLLTALNDYEATVRSKCSLFAHVRTYTCTCLFIFPAAGEKPCLLYTSPSPRDS